MSAKIIVGSVAVLGVLAGGAIVAARMGGGQSLPADDALVASVQGNEPIVRDNTPPTIIVDEREVTPEAEPGEGGGPPNRDAFQRDGGQFGGLNGEDMRAQMLARFDTDGDGELSREEREAAREAFRAEREERRQQWLLEQYDADGDGVLSESEQAKIEADRAEREAERERREAEMRQRALEAYDADGDGQLSREERRAGEERRREYMREQHAAFTARFDTDGDGEINGDERMAVRETMGQVFQEMRFVREFDQTGDNLVTADDMPGYMELFYEGDRQADVNADGVVDEADLADFRQRVLTPPSQDIVNAMAAWNNAPPPVDGDRGDWNGGGDDRRRGGDNNDRRRDTDSDSSGQRDPGGDGDDAPQSRPGGGQTRPGGGD